MKVIFNNRVGELIKQFDSTVDTGADIYAFSKNLDKQEVISMNFIFEDGVTGEETGTIFLENKWNLIAVQVITLNID